MYAPFQVIFIFSLSPFYRNRVIICPVIFPLSVLALLFIKYTHTHTHTWSWFHICVACFKIFKKYFENLSARALSGFIFLVIFRRCLRVSIRDRFQFTEHFHSEIHSGQWFSQLTFSLTDHWRSACWYKAMFLTIMVQIDRSKLSNIEMVIRPYRL